MLFGGGKGGDDIDLVGVGDGVVGAFAGWVAADYGVGFGSVAAGGVGLVDIGRGGVDELFNLYFGGGECERGDDLEGEGEGGGGEVVHNFNLDGGVVVRFGQAIADDADDAGCGVKVQFGVGVVTDEGVGDGVGIPAADVCQVERVDGAGRAGEDVFGVEFGFG